MNVRVQAPPAGNGTAPRVSVISVFLNAERFIAEAIESVLAQDFSDFELILVDDGSGDRSLEIARGYAAGHAPIVRYIDHEHHVNRGISASRNLGVSHARGELIAFIDADDVWEPGKLREQVALMDAHPELAMVCGAARYWRSWNGGTDAVVHTGHVRNCVVEPPEAALALYPLGRAASPCPSDLLLRRDLLMALGGFEEHFTGVRQLYEDQGFLAKLYLVAPVYFSDRVWIRYRQHADSCTAAVMRDDGYLVARGYFLEWFEGYLTTVSSPDRRVCAALAHSLWRHRHPVLDAAGARSAAIWRAITLFA